ncbi:hypothetical protein BCR34DRAFT_676805 [Clohesyomyces aquaticus]|uniref:Phytanoyl-CoA dioxygenase family protein n=1 Tax=Clohesyomyces aquaticus TaxID=1231657 RepID=A0A1Y1YNA7_9PLEO|nr:hypothetical protein BCR34DRAFT_676805 [Clohesyomyces aquaticus]
MASPTAEGLTSEQLAFFNENGYLIIPDALSPETVTGLLDETHKMLDEFSLDDHPMTKFSTGGADGAEHVGDKYFLESGDKIRFFFEEGTCVRQTRRPPKTHPPLHQQNRPLPALLLPALPLHLALPRNAAIARSLRYRDPRVLQSMVICKQPEIGGAVPPHQDSTFLYTDPPSAVGFWYALEDATVRNGCLSFCRGSQRREPIRKRFVRREGGAGTGFIENDGAKFPRDLEREEGGKEEEYTIGEVKAGTLVLIHGNILHKSERNTSGKSRFIYTFHVIEGEERYDERNWLQPPEQGFSRLYSKEVEAS